MASLRTIRKGRKPVYEVRWRDYETGRHHSRRVTDQMLARKLKLHGAEIEERTRLSRDLGPRRKGDVSRGWALERWYEEMTPTWAAKTAEQRRTVINSIPDGLKRMTLRAIDAGVIERFLKRRLSEAPSMVVWTRVVLNGTFKWAKKNRYIEENVLREVELPAGTRDKTTTGLRKVDIKLVLSPEEVMQIADTVDPVYRLFVLTLGFAGLRPGEAAALLVSDVDLEGKTISVTKGAGEGGRLKNPQSKRTVPMPSLLADELRRHIKERGLHQEDPLFSGRNGRPFNYKTFLRRHWHPALKQIKFKDPSKEHHRRGNGHSLYTPHDLRHTYISSLLTRGVNPAAVAVIAGHKHAGVTLAVYAGYFTEDTQAIAEAAEKMVREMQANSEEDAKKL